MLITAGKSCKNSSIDERSASTKSESIDATLTWPVRSPFKASSSLRDLVVVQHRLHVPEQPLAGGVQSHAVGNAVEQLEAELAFELEDLPVTALAAT